MLSFNRKIFAIFLLTLVAGITLSVVTYLRGQSVIATGRTLTERSLPRFDEIAHLQRTIYSQKPLLYEYYATLDRVGYASHFQAAQMKSQNILNNLARFYQGSAEMALIQQAVNRIGDLGVKLDLTMQRKPIDWDQAREILADVSAQESRITPAIEALLQLNRDQVTRYGNDTHQNVLAMIQTVAGFTIASVLLTLFAAYFVRVHLRESADRRMLAVFPERSPNPMLRLTEEGTVIYANEASLKLAIELGLEDVGGILPSDMTVRLDFMQQQDLKRKQYEYKVANRVFDCTIQRLPDLHICHLYLADITERKQAEERLLHQAQIDDVTGLPNRHMFRARVEQLLKHDESHCAVALIRPDHIKLLLESQGYATSDNLIAAMGERVQHAILGADFPALDLELFRFEGATFGLLVSHVTDTTALSPLLHRLKTATLEPLKAEEKEFFFTLSIGIALSPLHGTNAETLFKHAETAVNRMRAEGGNGARYYTQDLSEYANQWMELEHGLRRALERDELVLHYQPQIRLRDGNLIGFEALIRWNHPQRGLIDPIHFIPLAEASGLIIPIGNWVLRTACQQLKHWLDLGHNFVMAVNISARQFQQADIVEQVETILRESNLPAQHLELEITESFALHDIEHTIETLQALRQLGLLLSIDDFGTGFSSLNYLRRLPINKLKIDQSFIHNLGNNAQDASIAQTVILLGHSLNLTVIAEGVETPNQIALLRAMGCDEVQGHLFSHPGGAPEISKTLLMETNATGQFSSFLH